MRKYTKRLCFTVAAIGALLFVGRASYRDYRDFPAAPDAPPEAIADVLQATHTPCYVYPLGGIIDTEELWRIDGSPSTVASIIRKLDLTESKVIPEAFWHMPPYYWPRTRTVGMKAYFSAGFPLEGGRGDDGRHYFLLHDTKNNRAYVWLKDNF